MRFALDFNDMALLFAYLSLTLLISSELIKPRYFNTNFIIDGIKFRRFGLYLFSGFLIVIILKLFQLFISL